MVLLWSFLGFVAVFATGVVVVRSSSLDHSSLLLLFPGLDTETDDDGMVLVLSLSSGFVGVWRLWET